MQTIKMADASKLDDAAWSTWCIKSGPHAGHIAEVYSAKHNCGAYQIDVTCGCGATYTNAMNGCWQNGHQRPEEGDQALIP